MKYATLFVFLCLLLAQTKSAPKPVPFLTFMATYPLHVAGETDLQKQVVSEKQEEWLKQHLGESCIDAASITGVTLETVKDDDGTETKFVTVVGVVDFGTMNTAFRKNAPRRVLVYIRYTDSPENRKNFGDLKRGTKFQTTYATQQITGSGVGTDPFKVVASPISPADKSHP